MQQTYVPLGIFFCQASYQSNNAGVDRLHLCILRYILRIPRNDRPPQLSVAISQAQQSFDDLENTKHSEFLLLDEVIITIRVRGVLCDIRCNPEQVIK